MSDEVNYSTMLFTFGGRKVSPSSSVKAHDDERATGENLISGGSERHPLPGSGALRDYFQQQDVEIEYAVDCRNQRKAAEIANMALRGPPEPPLFYRMKWEGLLALGEAIAPHIKRYYCDACRKSLQALQEQIDSVRYLQEAIVAGPVMMEDEYKLILDTRNLLDEQSRKLDDEYRKQLG